MARAHFRDVIAAPASGGNALIAQPGATVLVLDSVTGLPLGQTIFSGPSGAGTLSNPFPADAQGRAEFWLDTDERVRLQVSQPGYATRNEIVDVSAQQTLTGPDIIGGTMTGVNISGGSFVGVPTFADGIIVGSNGSIVMQATQSEIIPGATSFAIRDSSDTANNFIVTDTGVATFRNNVNINSPGNLILGSLFQRIKGDFTNIDRSARVLIQTTVTDGSTSVGIIPDGTSISSEFIAYNRPDPNNAAYLSLSVNDFSADILTSSTGTPVTFALTLRIQGGARMNLWASGGLSIFSGADPGAGVVSIAGDASLSGRVAFTGNFSGTNTSGTIYTHTSDGLVLRGAVGSTNDLVLLNKTGQIALWIPTGTQNVSIAGYSTWTGNVTPPAGAAGKTLVNGLVARAVTGSTNDYQIQSAAGTAVLSVPTGTTNVVLAGALTVSGTITGTTTGNVVNPMTTAGDIIIGGSAPAGTPTRLAAATNGWVLTLVAGNPAWAAPVTGFANPMTTAEDMMKATAGGTAVRMAKGADNTILQVVAGVVQWAPSITVTGESNSGRTTWTANTTGAAASIYKDAGNGLVVQGVTGSGNDFTLLNNATGGQVMYVPTGTQNSTFVGIVSVSRGNAHGALAISSTTGTNGATLQFNNTAGAAYIGLDTSTSGIFGGAAYALAFFAPSGRTIEFISSGTASTRMTLETAGSLTMRNRITFVANGTGPGAASIYRDAAGGIVIWGVTGSTSDVTILNNTGNAYLSCLTGTQDVSHPGNISVGNVTPNGAAIINAGKTQNNITTININNGDPGSTALAGFQANSNACALLLSAMSSTYAAPYAGRGLVQSNATAGLMIQNTNNGGIFFYPGAGSGSTLGAYFNGAGTLSPGGTTMDLGNTGERWRTIYSQNTLNVSHSSYKQDWAPLDPNTALQVVRDTVVGTFRYKPLGDDDHTANWTRVGILADHSHSFLSPDHEHVNAQDTACLALAAVKALADKLDRLALI